MSRFFRFLGIGLLGALVIILVLGITLIFYNIEDDQLEPDVVQLLAETPHQVDAADNGYFAWIGVVGPDSVPPYEWGRNWFEEALTADKKRSGAPLAIEAEIKPYSLQTEEMPCGRIENCLDEVIEQPAAAHKVLDQAMSMLERCDSAMGYTYYQEPWHPHLSFISQLPYYHQSACRVLQATRFALAVAETRDEDAIGHLEKEVAFHVRQMQGSTTLLDKVMAIFYLKKDYMLLNQYLLRRPEAASRNIGRLTKLLAPLDRKASSMTTVLKTEWLFGARAFLDQPNIASSADESDAEMWNDQGGIIDKAIRGLFYLPNATVNEHYRWYVPFANAERLSGVSYRKALAMAENKQVTGRDDVLFGFFSLRNPVGYILVQIAQTTLVSYFEVRDDLLALRAAVAFQLDLLGRGIAEEDAIAQAVATAELVHPYSGETAIWDRASRTLIYSAQPECDDKPLAIRF